MPNIYFYIDGTYIKTTTQMLEVFTPGQAKYNGVFETLLVQQGKINFIDEHLKRMNTGLKKLRIKAPHSPSELKSIAATIVKKNPIYNEARLRLMVFKEKDHVHCVGMIMRYKPYSTKQYKEGLKATVVKTNRKPSAEFANVKTLDYALFANALKTAQEQKYDEAILLNKYGHVFEASRGNIFILHQNQWLTPPLTSGCLNGIMRQQVLTLAKRQGILIQEKSITLSTFKAAKQIFMTNSLVGLIRLTL